MSNSPVYRRWRAMINRCSNPNVKSFPDYGGRGIKVCERWSSFEAFFEDMGLPPDGHEIERMDNDGDYCPENCTWATRDAQMNNRTNNIVLTLDGKTMTLARWAKELNLPYCRLRMRYAAGLPVERILDRSKRVNQYG